MTACYRCIELDEICFESDRSKPGERYQCIGCRAFFTGGKDDTKKVWKDNLFNRAYLYDGGSD